MGQGLPCPNDWPLSGHPPRDGQVAHDSGQDPDLSVTEVTEASPGPGQAADI